MVMVPKGLLSVVKLESKMGIRYKKKNKKKSVNFWQSDQIMSQGKRCKNNGYNYN